MLNSNRKRDLVRGQMNKQLAIPMTLPTGNMEAYISAAFQLPVLSQEEEYALAKRCREHNDLNAARFKGKYPQYFPDESELKESTEDDSAPKGWSPT